MNKTVITIVAGIALVVSLYFVFTPSAHAQLKPCVWPNTCMA